MPTKTERDRRLDCSNNCRVFAAFRQADDEFLRGMADVYGPLTAAEFATLKQNYRLVTQ